MDFLEIKFMDRQLGQVISNSCSPTTRPLDLHVGLARIGVYSVGLFFIGVNFIIWSSIQFDDPNIQHQEF
jgi:hypothetical protein